MILSKGLQNYVESVKYSKHDHLHDDKVQSTNKKIHRINKINSILAYWLVHFIDEIKLSSRSWSNISAAFLYCRFFLFDLQRNMNELSTKIKDICLFILLKCCHNCGENVFAVWAAELSVLLPSPDPLPNSLFCYWILFGVVYWSGWLKSNKNNTCWQFNNLFI